ncbi:MAG: rod shape-determining protein MreC [Bacteroidales bacterium]|nr:rod shape-determining protein MreC [Bacteroidales bacterium]
MNNLIEFIKNYFHHFLAAVLLVICFVLIGNSMSYNRYKIARICQSITMPIEKSWGKLIHHFSLNKENEQLLQQNLELLREQENMYLVKEDTTLTQMSETDSIHTERIRMYDYTYAHVTYSTTDKPFNYIVIDKGSKDGLERDMAVLSPVGIVGVVSDVSKNFSSIIPIPHLDTRISALVPTINQVGTVVWDGKDPGIAYLNDVPQHLEINIGDSILTSGFSTIYPKGILIGTVKEVSSEQNATFLTIKVKLATDFKNLDLVYVVKNLYRSEIDSLKANFKDE